MRRALPLLLAAVLAACQGTPATRPTASRAPTVPGAASPTPAPAATSAAPWPSPLAPLQLAPDPSPSAVIGSGWTVSTLAGQADSGDTTGSALGAFIAGPRGLAGAPDGSFYLVDTDAGVIWRVAADGTISRLAGSGSGYADGRGAQARFRGPTGALVDKAGDLYVVDSENHVIRRIKPDGTTSTFAGALYSGNHDGPANRAGFTHPLSLAFDAAGDMYVGTFGDHNIRKIAMADPAHPVTTIAGTGKGGKDDGPGKEATFSIPYALACRGSTLYVADADNHRIRAIDLASPSHPVTTLAGGKAGYEDGPAKDARFVVPQGLVLVGDCLYVGDTGNHRIRVIDLADPAHPVTTVAGDGNANDLDGPALKAQLHLPGQLGLDAAGDVLIADQGSHRVRKLRLATLEVTTVAGNGEGRYRDGPAAQALFGEPSGLVYDPAGKLYVADRLNHRVRAIDLLAPGHPVTTVAGGLRAAMVEGAGAQARFSFPSALALDAQGTLYVADTETERIRRITFDAGGAQVTSVAAGVSDDDRLDFGRGLCVGADGKLYASDQVKNRVMVASVIGQPLAVLAGAAESGWVDGAAALARFNAPQGLVLDGGTLYVADGGNGRVRAIAPDGTVSTLAGSVAKGHADGPALTAMFRRPAALALDGDGNLLVVDETAACVRRIALKAPGRPVTTLAGTQESGYQDGALARFSAPRAIAVAKDGTIYIADARNHLIRALTPPR